MLRRISSLIRNIKYSLSLDVRSLAVFRIVLGLTCIGDLIDRATDLHAHYTDTGLFPRADAVTHYCSNSNFVIHWINGSSQFAVIIFFVHFLFCVGLCIGYKTTLNTFLVWVLTISLHAAAPYVGHSGDVFHRLLLFWGFFLPLGQVWSVDATLKQWQEPKKKPSSSLSSHLHFSAASIGLLIQIVLVYTISYYHKTGPEWHIDRTAVFYALNLDYFQMPAARLLLSLPDWVLKVLCVVTLFWEKYGPFTFMIPFKTDYWRILGCIGFWGMHLGFGICLRLGLFYFITTTLFFACIPSLFWEWFIPSLKRRDRLEVKVYYNPKNSFSSGVTFFLTMFMIDETTIIPSIKETHKYDEEAKVDHYLSSPRETEPSHIWLVTTNGKEEYTGLRALTYCLSLTPLLWFIAFILARMPKSLLGLLEQWTTTATLISHINKPFVEPKPNHKKHPLQVKYKKYKQRGLALLYFILQLFLVFAIYMSICWNLSNLGLTEWSPRPIFKEVVWIIKVDQQWNMFSPAPPKTSWYYYIEGELLNQQKVELFKNEAIFTWQYNYDMDDGPPNPFYKSFKNHRWFKFFENGFNQDNQYLRLSFGRYLCRGFNSRHELNEQVWSFKIFLISITTELSGEKVRTGKENLWSHQCFEEKPIINVVEQKVD